MYYTYAPLFAFKKNEERKHILKNCKSTQSYPFTNNSLRLSQTNSKTTTLSYCDNVQFAFCLRTEYHDKVN
jgi:hypothetical protein